MSLLNFPRLTRAIPTLRVERTDAALFVFRALGFEVAWEHRLGPEAPHLVCIRQGEVEVFLTEHPVTEPGAVVYFTTEDVDALVAAAALEGVIPEFGPETRPWGNREAYFRDPDGNMLRFGQQGVSPEQSSFRTED